MKTFIAILFLTLLSTSAFADETVKFTDIIGEDISTDESCEWKKSDDKASGYDQHVCASFPGPSDFNGVFTVALTEDDGTIVAVTGLKKMDSDLVKGRYTSLGAHFEKTCEVKEKNAYNATFACPDKPDVFIAYDYSDGLTLMYMESLEKILESSQKADEKQNEGL